MIPLPYPKSDYEWGSAEPLANWTSGPLYSYEQFARANGKLAPSPTIGIRKPYRMPDNAGPYLPRVVPYGQYGRPATYEVAKENTTAAPPPPPPPPSSRNLWPGVIVEVPAKWSSMQPTRWLFPAILHKDFRLDKPRYDLGERSGRVTAVVAANYAECAREAMDLALRATGNVNIILVKGDLSQTPIDFDQLERLTRRDDVTLPDVAKEVHDALTSGKYTLSPILLNPRRGYAEGERERLPTSAFLKPETRSWPVSDKDHAFIALQYMTRGFGNRSEYPTLIQRLAQIWPPSRHPDVWAWYESHRGQIEEKAGRAMPRIGRANGRAVVRRGKPGQVKPYFYMSSKELQACLAEGRPGAKEEAARRGWQNGQPTYKIGKR